MPHISMSDFRQNLSAHLDAVELDRAPLFVTRNRKKAVVILSEDEFESMMETCHLLSSPANAGRLRASIAEANAAQGDVRTLIDPDDRTA
ncbi:antitoxin YefM [Rhizobium sp. SG_E_25_P2]|uniref:type II toxin-antitoxin system Phd/YefM family antitoxin n=1 Tax=Rhizobium sp. SG_E_25_P2 TaxID=2879942 RepID=UPI00247406E3|nr:type II toxin-antitoxin system prevent-host-death family antitoxin [Rhizobium sp. SG_E_25_P2]MDH6267291.1 antitoxin YefM [Rhizobium sp. SG_E_25_P2]